MPCLLLSASQTPKMPHRAASPGRQSLIASPFCAPVAALMPSAAPGTNTRRVCSRPWNVNLSLKHCLTVLHCVKTVASRASSSWPADRKPDLRSGEPSE